MSHADDRSRGKRSFAADLLVLLGRRRRAFLGFLRARTRADADAEDLLQQSLLKATEKIDTLRDQDRLAPWFYRILRRTLADSVAQRARDDQRIEALRAEAELGAQEEAAFCACSLGFLEHMRPEYREMLRRVDIEGDAIADVAVSLGITSNNATVRLSRARAELRAELLRSCRTRSVASCSTCACERVLGSS
jgi:RNA polymerase sigma factor (sigma-70 family)